MKYTFLNMTNVFPFLEKILFFYDYKEPLNIPARIPKNYFDVVFADPPFLSEECFAEVAKTVEYLMKEKVIFCTGLCYCILM